MLIDWNNMDFGEKIKHLRNSMGMSQGELAKRSGLAQSSISYIESGMKKPNIDTITALANALEAHIATLFDSSQLNEAFPPRLSELVQIASFLSDEKLDL